MHENLAPVEARCVSTSSAPQPCGAPSRKVQDALDMDINTALSPVAAALSLHGSPPQHLAPSARG
eukprot:6810353-Pyramimonas_sp.AAC.1